MTEVSSCTNGVTMNRIHLQVCGLAILLVIAMIAPLNAQKATKLSSKSFKPGAAIEGLKNPTKLILYRLDKKNEFKPNLAGNLIDAKATYGGCPILGKVELTDQTDRDELIAALQDAVVNHDNDAANCFDPGNAIFAVENEKTYDIVICFKCGQYMVNGSGFRFISRRAAANFNSSYLRGQNATTAK